MIDNIYAQAKYITKPTRSSRLARVKASLRMLWAVITNDSPIGCYFKLADGSSIVLLHGNTEWLYSASTEMMSRAQQVLDDQNLKNAAMLARGRL